MMSGVSIKIGQLIRQKRMENKITLRKFSEMLGISMTELSQIERGDGKITYNLFYRAVHLLAIERERIEEALERYPI